MKTITSALASAVATIAIGALFLQPMALGADAQPARAATPRAATAVLATALPVGTTIAASGGQRGIEPGRDASQGASEPRCERVQRIGKFVMTRCD